jgi:hypothetical protein
MRALKILVVVMGVLLVGGTAALIAAIIDRASRHTATPSASAPTPSGRGFERAAVPLPPGARVVSAELAGDRILVRLARAEGGEALIIIDAKSGAALGTIDLLPSNAPEAKP